MISYRQFDVRFLKAICSYMVYIRANWYADVFIFDYMTNPGGNYQQILREQLVTGYKLIHLMTFFGYHCKS